MLAATDPAQPYGAALRWPAREGDHDAGAGARRPQRVAGAYVVLAGAEPVLYVERGGRGIALLAGPDDARVAAAFAALAAFGTDGRHKLKLALERIDGEPVVGSRWEPLLVEAGFRAGPRKLTLSA